MGAATDPDVNSQYWNPAKYPFCISRAGVALNFTPWLRSLVNDMNLAYLAGYYRIGDHSAVSSSLRYFNLGKVYTSYEGAESGEGTTINPYEMSLDVAYSLMLSETFSLSAALRWIYSDMRLMSARTILLLLPSLPILQPIIRTISTSASVSASWVSVSTFPTSVVRSSLAAMSTASSCQPTSDWAPR